MNYIIVKSTDLYRYLNNVCKVDTDNVIPKENNTYNYMYQNTPYIRKLIQNYNKEYNK